jgi:LmbE family N-acetylglucosaminyl deacetylase
MNILAIGCHPDDVEIACAGTLAKCVKRGDKVIVSHLCTGSLGHVVIPPEELVPMRAAEAREAGKLAGIEVLDGVFGDLDPERDEPSASGVAGSLGMTRSDYLRSLVRKDLASA